MEGSRAGVAASGIGGAILIVLGAIWFAIGAVLLVLAWIYGRGTGALPPALDFDANLVTAAPRSAGLGLVGAAAGIAQAVVGYGVARGTSAWAPRAGAVLGAAGAALTGFWLVTGLGNGDPVHILVAPLAAYLFATWVLLSAPSAR